MSDTTGPEDVGGPGSWDPHEATVQRSTAFAALVTQTLGADFTFVTACWETSRLVVAYLWEQRKENQDVLASIVAVSVATDALWAARRGLLAGDLLAVYADLRRCFEMQMLGLAAFHQPDVGVGWLEGRDIRPKALRQIVIAHDSTAENVVDRLYMLLSEPSHGKVQALSAYRNRWGRFQWPIEPEFSPPDGLKQAFSTVTEMSFNLAHLEERVTNTWNRIHDLPLRQLAVNNYGLFVYYMKHHALGNDGYGEWVRLEPGTATEWLTLSSIPDPADGMTH